MAAIEEDIKRFLSVGSGSGYGYGSGYGSGYGDGSGSGYGSGDGSGYGYGYGYGYGSGYGDGSGSGYGSGDGSGDGSGSGYGYGDGYGSGYGSGYGYGDGYGDGSGYGDGYGSGVNEYNGHKVYVIDGVQTLIDSVHRNYAKGHILNKDLTLTPCYIAKVGNFFAHGKTLKEAARDAQTKYDENMPLEDRIARFKDKYPTLDTVVSGTELFDWHHVLTGSCKMGRESFCAEHGIVPETASISVREFIELTKDAYGGANILELERAYQ